MDVFVCLCDVYGDDYDCIRCPPGLEEYWVLLDCTTWNNAREPHFVSNHGIADQISSNCMAVKSPINDIYLLK